MSSPSKQSTSNKASKKYEQKERQLLDLQLQTKEQQEDLPTPEQEVEALRYKLEFVLDKYKKLKTHLDKAIEASQKKSKQISSLKKSLKAAVTSSPSSKENHPSLSEDEKEKKIASLESALQEHQQRREQLERVIHFLRDRSERLKSENTSLEEEIQELEEELQKQKEENKRASAAFQNEVLLEEKNRLLEETQKELKYVCEQIGAIRNSYYEQRKAKEGQERKNEELIQRVRELQIRIEQQELQKRELADLKLHIERIEEENLALKALQEEIASSKELQKHVEELEQKLKIKQQQISSLQEEEQKFSLEKKQIEQKQETLHSTILDLEAKLEMKENIFQKSQREWEEKFSAYKEAAKSLHSLQQQFQQKDEEVSRLQNTLPLYEKKANELQLRTEEDQKTLEAQKERISELEADKSSLEQRLYQLTEEHKHQASELTEVKERLKEMEERAKSAQSHLAKKVKEFTLLHDENELQKKKILEALNEQESYKARLNEEERKRKTAEEQLQNVENILEEQKIRQKQQEAQWEAAGKKADEQLQQMRQLLQKQEEQSRSLTQKMDKYEQLKRLMSDLTEEKKTGSKSLSFEEEKKPEQKPSSTKLPANPYGSLFDLTPVQQQKSKNSLFDE